MLISAVCQCGTGKFGIDLCFCDLASGIQNPFAESKQSSRPNPETWSGIRGRPEQAMSGIRYVLQAFGPEKGSEPVFSFESDVPFMLPEPGAIICADDGDRFRVSRIEHHFSTSQGLTQTLRVHVDPLSSVELAGRARELMDRLRWKGRGRDTEIVTSELSEEEGAFMALDDLLPTVEALWRTNLGPLARSAIEDGEATQRAFRATYELLPATIRVLVTEERFIEFCERHREHLLEQDWLNPEEGPPSGI